MTSATFGLLSFHEAQGPVCCGGPKQVFQHLHTPQLSGGVNLRLFIDAQTFSDVKKFLERDNLPPTSTKLLLVLNDPAKTRKLKMEIATTVDAMEPFVNTTYKLEGDGPLILEANLQLSILFAFVSTQYYPNVAAVAKAEANGNASHEQQLLDYSKACVQPAYNYFY